MFPFASLPENLVAFAAILRREHGFNVGPGELRDAARALEVVPLTNEQAVRDALRPILCGTLREVAIFDRAFTAFMFPDRDARLDADSASVVRPGPGADADADDAVEGSRQVAASDFEAEAVDVDRVAPEESIDPIESAESDGGESALLARSTYSPLHAESTDSPALNAADEAWRAAAAALVRRLRVGLSRRLKPTKRGHRFDLRRTLRASVQTGGEALTARWLRRQRREPRIVVLVDGSRSMSAHARVGLQIAVAIASVTRRIEVFTFSTSLERVTPDVRRAAAGEARRLEPAGYAWGGGTSIGLCLRDFVRRFGERLLGRNTIVIIASDGLDVGELETLQGAMGELHRRAASLVWLNPLLGTPGYAPTARGMSAARPFVTTFASVTDVASFARLSRLVRLRA
jgi:uncharacterized protein with von Willebrand factor type A (vWA) domain